MTKRTIFDENLERNPANYEPLTPLSFLERTAGVYPERTAVIYGDRRYTWAQVNERCKRLASALRRRGVSRGDTVSIIASNTPELLEAHLGLSMTGAVLNSINVRLDVATVNYILKHGEAKVLVTDRQYSNTAKRALEGLRPKPLVVDIDDRSITDGELIGELDYEGLLKEGDPDFKAPRLEDEWDAVTLNYTSGTTADPKGVVCSHRGVYLNALGNVMLAGMTLHPIYLWTLPMFHANGWCFPWTVTVLGGTHVCLRRVEPGPIFDLLVEHGVTHLCGAPVVLNMLINATEHERKPLPRRVTMVTAGSAPPAAVLAGMERLGFEVVHGYGLTETYGASVVSAWKSEWDGLPLQQRARLKARQGVKTVVEAGAMVADPETLEPVVPDGKTPGEILLRGNIMMKGYLKNPAATKEAFRGGWFHSGDVGVMHPDGYLEVTDRSKDIVISGGENISSVEVENTLYGHPAVLEAAVVARPDPKWGEAPCAFVTLKPGANVGAEELIAFCRERLAGFKVPRTVVFSELPKTATGKVQKFVLRERARTLSEKETAGG